MASFDRAADNAVVTALEYLYIKFISHLFKQKCDHFKSESLKRNC